MHPRPARAPAAAAADDDDDSTMALPARPDPAHLRQTHKPADCAQFIRRELEWVRWQMAHRSDLGPPEPVPDPDAAAAAAKSKTAEEAAKRNAALGRKKRESMFVAMHPARNRQPTPRGGGGLAAAAVGKTGGKQGGEEGGDAVGDGHGRDADARPSPALQREKGPVVTKIPSNGMVAKRGEEKRDEGG
jgi:hypothetical protein